LSIRSSDETRYQDGGSSRFGREGRRIDPQEALAVLLPSREPFVRIMTCLELALDRARERDQPPGRLSWDRRAARSGDRIAFLQAAPDTPLSPATTSSGQGPGAATPALRWEDKDAANRDGRPPRRFYTLTGVGQREARALLAERFKGQLRFSPGGGAG
jgi:hypothetical protein